MQGTDCRNFREMLDSYFCEELAVETNHAILRHAEHCAPCRREMAVRRELRQKLRHACSQDRMSPAAAERLRTCLRSEAKACAQNRRRPGEWAASLLTRRVLLPVAGCALALVMFGTFWLTSGSKNGLSDPESSLANSSANSSASSSASSLASSLMDAAAMDHLRCGSKYASSTSAMILAEALQREDPAYAGLGEVAAAGALRAGDLALRSAHVCHEKGRGFAHLVYLRQAEIISLQVTARDSAAMESGALPDDDGAACEMQRAFHSGLTLGAFQTRKHIVLVVAPISPADGQALAENLGRPVAEHLRRFEAGQGKISLRQQSAHHRVFAMTGLIEKLEPMKFFKLIGEM